jgi:hypothetical protein
MKRTIIAAAVALSAAAPLAQADVQTTFPDGYTVVADADKLPITNARSDWEIRKNFPRGSFRTGDAIQPADRAAAVVPAKSSAEILASFPQPSSVAN